MKGNLITVWNPFCARMGATTTAIGLAIALSWVGNKKTLLTSMSEDGKLTLYLSGDVEMRYKLDWLKVFGEQITVDSITNYTTALTNKMDVIGGYGLSSRQGGGSNFSNFEKCFIDEALKHYDFLVLDMSNEFDAQVLEKSALVAAMVPFERTALDELYKDGELSSVMKNTKVKPVFNKTPYGLEKELERITKEYGIEDYIYLPDNRHVHQSVAIDYDFFRFISQNMKKSKQRYITNLMLLYDMVLEEELSEFDAEPNESRTARLKRFFGRTAATE